MRIQELDQNEQKSKVKKQAISLEQKQVLFIRYKNDSKIDIFTIHWNGDILELNTSFKELCESEKFLN